MMSARGSASQIDHHHRASASEVSKVQNARSDASVHGIVIM